MRIKYHTSSWRKSSGFTSPLASLALSSITFLNEIYKPNNQCDDDTASWSSLSTGGSGGWNGALRNVIENKREF
jgi:hypothetical protein